MFDTTLDRGSIRSTACTRRGLPRSRCRVTQRATSNDTRVRVEELGHAPATVSTHEQSGQAKQAVELRLRKVVAMPDAAHSRALAFGQLHTMRRCEVTGLGGAAARVALRDWPAGCRHGGTEWAW